MSLSARADVYVAHDTLNWPISSLSRGARLIRVLYRKLNEAVGTNAEIPYA